MSETRGDQRVPFDAAAAAAQLMEWGQARHAKDTSRLAPHELLLTPAERLGLRVEANVTQRELAEMIGVNVGTVSGWERGARALRGRNAKAYIDILHALEAEIARVNSEGDQDDCEPERSAT